jgi:hypothetical protein
MSSHRFRFRLKDQHITIANLKQSGSKSAHKINKTLRGRIVAGVEDNETIRRVTIKSIRLTEIHLSLIMEECARRRLSFSDYARMSLLGNLSRDTKRRAIALWGNSNR